MRPIWYVVLGVAISLLAMLLWHQRHTALSEEVGVTYDTLTYSNYPPTMVTVPTDPDSLTLYHFRDSVDGLWSADVAGRDVELRSLVLRERHTTSYAPPTWEVMVLGGITTTSSWVGVGVERNIGRLKLSMGAGYDPFNQTPHVEGRVGVSIWREK